MLFNYNYRLGGQYTGKIFARVFSMDRPKTQNNILIKFRLGLRDRGQISQSNRTLTQPIKLQESQG